MNFQDRVSTYPNRYKMNKQDGTSEYVTLERADSPTTVGTPLNADTFNAAFAEKAPIGHTENKNNPHDVTAEQVGAAPAGYGLGERVGRYCADCWGGSQVGLYYVDENTANKPDGITGKSVLLVEALPTDYNYGVDFYLTLKHGKQIWNSYYSSWAGQWQPWVNMSEATAVSTAVGGVVLKKINDVVYISVPTGYAVIGAVTIPEGYRPSRDLAMLCIYHSPSYVMCEAVLTIGANGSITVKYGSGNIASDGWFCVTTSYHIKQS